MAVNQNIPDAWSSYVTQTNLGLEVIPGFLYDTLPILAGATPPNLSTYKFFQQSNVTPDVSNMKNAGMLANPEAFLIQNLRFVFQTPMAPDMTMAAALSFFIYVSVLTLTIGNKIYGPFPMSMIGAANTVIGCNTGATDCFFPQTSGPLYPLFPNLMLSPLQPFNATIQVTQPGPTWPATTAVSVPQNFPGIPSTTNNAVARLQIVFDGQQARSIQ